MSFYGSLADTAKKLIADKGRTVTLRSGSPVYDPITDTMTGGTTDTEVKAVFTAFRSDEVDGTLIQRGDKKVIVDAKAAPQSGDAIIDGTTQYEIVDVMEVQPGEPTIIYKLQARK